LQIDYIASKAVSAIVKKKGITMDYKSEIHRMIDEIDDADVLMRVYFFIRFKYRRLKGWVDRG